MTAFTNYLEGKVIDHIFRTASFAKPTVLGIGLMSAVSDGEAGTVTELSGNGYARVADNPLDANWAAPSGGNGTTSNSTTITFPTASGGDWATATHFGIWDATSGGNLLIVSALTSSRTVTNGATASFAPGALTVQADN